MNKTGFNFLMPPRSWWVKFNWQMSFSRLNDQLVITCVTRQLKQHLASSRQTRYVALQLLTVPELTTDLARRLFSHVAPAGPD